MKREGDDVCGIMCIHPEKVAKFKDSIPNVSGLAELFKVLGDETRIKILYILSEEEMCVCDIASVLKTTVSNVSHHLRLLRGAGLVRYRKEGKVVYYTLDDHHVISLFKEGFEHVMHKKTD